MKLLKPIRTEEDYDLALERSWQLMQRKPKPDSNQGRELEVWTTLIELYEADNYEIPDPDPINHILFIMEQRGLKQVDLVPFIGHKSKVSEVLNRKRKLSIEMIRALSEGLDIPARILIQDYSLSSSKRKKSTLKTAKKGTRGKSSPKTRA